MKVKFQNLRALAVRNAKKAGALALVGGSAVANAAVDPGVSTSLLDAKVDVSTVGLAVFVIAVAIAIYKWFRRAL